MRKWAQRWETQTNDKIRKSARKYDNVRNCAQCWKVHKALGKNENTLIEKYNFSLSSILYFWLISSGWNWAIRLLRCLVLKNFYLVNLFQSYFPKGVCCNCCLKLSSVSKILKTQ